MEITSEYGIYDQRFEKVFNKFKENLTSSVDIGASFAVYSNGKPLVDLVGGYKNKEKTGVRVRMLHTSKKCAMCVRLGTKIRAH